MKPSRHELEMQRKKLADCLQLPSERLVLEKQGKLELAQGILLEFDKMLAAEAEPDCLPDRELPLTVRHGLVEYQTPF